MKIALVAWSIVLILALTLSRFLNFPFWIALIIVAAAFIVNGIIAEIEDRQPGGFLNLKKKDEQNAKQ